MFPFLCSSFSPDFGLFILRIGMGSIFLFHGYPKLMGGQTTWLWLGSQLTMFGITFMPVIFGFIAACVEFFGGVSLILGVGTCYATFLLVIQMIVATCYHLHRGDSFMIYSHALSLIVVFSALFLMGPGKYTVYMLLG